MATLNIRKLNKSYGDVHVLKDIDLDIADGEFTVFVGPSGCGKSTLLRMVCGLDEITSGELAIDSEIVNDVPSSKRGIAMVFQSYALYPHMSVAANMGYALRLSKTPKDEIDKRVQAAAEILKIDQYLDRKPRQLSGGQRQRVAIGRAIVREPRIFLFDEPLSNLDAALRVDMRIEFARLKKRLGTTMIYVTHDQVEAMTLADNIVVMNEGRIEQVGSPLELYNQPVNRFVAGFIGSPKMNFLPVFNENERTLEVPGGTLRKNGNHNLKGVTEIGLRPEHVAISQNGTEGIAGTIMRVEHLGSDTFAYIELPKAERPFLVRMEGDESVNMGQKVNLQFSSEATHFFNEDRQALFLTN